MILLEKKVITQTSLVNPEIFTTVGRFSCDSSQKLTVEKNMCKIKIILLDIRQIFNLYHAVIKFSVCVPEFDISSYLFSMSLKKRK